MVNYFSFKLEPEKEQPGQEFDPDAVEIVRGLEEPIEKNLAARGCQLVYLAGPLIIGPLGAAL